MKPDPKRKGIIILSIGIIGLGGVSRYYVDATLRSPELALAGVCDLKPERLDRFRNDSSVAVYHDFAALLADGRIDAVVVDTPVATHVEICRAALEAGKHVCCEKPLAIATADAQSLLELARGHELTLFTAFHRRYNRAMPLPGTLPLEGLASVESRYFETIEEHTEDSSWYAMPASEGGGCIVDNGPNAYDVVRHLFGEVTVEGVEVTRSATGVDLQAVVYGRVGSAEVVIRLDWAFEGELKDLRASWRDGMALHVDMLAGSTGFKSSLEHEYVGVLDDFAGHALSRRQDEHGLAATVWLDDVLSRIGPLG